MFSTPALFAGPGNIQGIPTSTMYQLFGGSYDSMNKYASGAVLNGLNLGNISHLGASWSRSQYSAKQNAFGVLAFDNMIAISQVYNNGVTVNGLIGGDNWSGPYASRSQAFPAMTWDSMTNYVSTPILIDGIGTVNGGTNNDTGTLVWNGGYIDGLAAPISSPTNGPVSIPLDPVRVAPIAFGGLMDASTNSAQSINGVYGFEFVANHDLMLTGLGRFQGALRTADLNLYLLGLDDTVNAGSSMKNSGTTNVWVYGSLANLLTGQFGTAVKLTKGNRYKLTSVEINNGQACYVYTTNTVLAPSPLIGVMGPVLGNTFTAQTNTSYGPYALLVDMGLLWITNVVANGGAIPSANSITNQSLFYTNLITDGLEASMIAVNAFATDSLVAAQSPLVYYKGNQPWVNHNFVAGDLTINGLVGDAATKYLDTGIAVTQLPLTSNSAGLTVYCYNNPASGSLAAALGVRNSTPANSAFELWPNSTGLSIGGLWGSNGGGNGVGPSAPAAPDGFFSLERTAANNLTLYFSSSLNPHSSIAVNTTPETVGIATGTQPLYVFALNNIGSLFGFSSVRISSITLNAGLSSAQSANLYAREQTLRTAFGGGFR